MKKQIKFFLTFLSTLLICCSLFAQPTRIDYTSTGYYTGTYTDIIVPSTAVGKYMVLTSVGGSGGHANYENSHRNGGRGAYVQGAFPITNSNRESIQPGDRIRFIVGGYGRGKHDNNHNDIAAAGGGGTGICHYNQRTQRWNILMVAGGGSGGARGWADNIGKPGKKYTRNMTYPIVTRQEYTLGYGVGVTGGYTVHGDRSDWTAYSGIQAGEPIGGSAIGYKDDDYMLSGGWGFGPGGRGSNVTAISDDYLKKGDRGPGGGGGYSMSELFTGGYSYLNEAMAHFDFLSFERGTTYDGENGYALYEYRSSPELATYQIEPINKAGYCISSAYGSTAENTALQLVKCKNTASEKVNWAPDLQSFRLFAQTERCMDVSSTNTGTGVKLHNCNNSDGQEWIYDGITQHIRYINDKTKCLSWDKSDNFKIKLASCANINYQKWNLSGATVLDLGEDNVATIHPVTNETKCIDNKGGKIVEGNPIQLSRCVENDNKNNQKWFFDGYGIRLSEDRSKCLDVPSTSNSTALRLYYCHATSHGAESHEWVYDGLTKMIRFRDNLNKCLSFDGENAADGANILIDDCKQDTKMQWTLQQATPNSNDAIFGKIKHASGRCLDLKSSNASNGANIQSWPCNGTQAQEWFVQGKQIKLAKDLGMCIDLSHANTSDNTNIQLYQCNGTDAQDWIFDVPNQFIRSSKDPTKCLYVDNKNNIVLNPCDYDNPSRMQWTLPGNYSERLSGDKLRIHLSKNESKCVDMARNANSTGLRVWGCQSDNSQYFIFDGMAIKRANNTKLCVGMPYNGGVTNGGSIRLWTCDGRNVQKWIYDGVSGRIHYKKDPNKCMEFDAGKTTNGTSIKIMDCNDDKSQVFVIK